MNEFAMTVIAGVLSGGVCVAVIEGVREWLAWKRSKQDKLEDRKHQKNDTIEKLQASVKKIEQEEQRVSSEDKKHFENIEYDIKTLKEGVKFILLDRILYLGEKYIEQGEISIDEKRLLRKMYSVYHTGLDGNGDADIIMDAIDELPMKS